MQCINSTMLSRSIYLHISVQGPQTLIKWVTLLTAQTVSYTLFTLEIYDFRNTSTA